MNEPRQGRGGPPLRRGSKVSSPAAAAAKEARAAAPVGGLWGGRRGWPGPVEAGP